MKLDEKAGYGLSAGSIMVAMATMMTDIGLKAMAGILLACMIGSLIGAMMIFHSGVKDEFGID